MFQSTFFLALVAMATASPVEKRQATSMTTESMPESTVLPYEFTPSTNMLADGTKQFQIHQSCNSTERHQLNSALNEMTFLAAHARDHILRWGNSSTHFNRYFGHASTAEPIGWYSRIVDADKTGALFRCDDPDMNCATQDAWAGHWRGENATEETVICDLSFQIRNPLNAMCGRGYTVANSPTNFYFASDLMHRVLHVPTVSEGVVDHYTEDYAEALELAMTEPELSVRDSDTLQWFALDVYAFDIANPGVGCTGEYVPEETSSVESSMMSSTSMSSTSSASPTPEPTTMVTAASAMESASMTTSADESCHTHDDGVIHCT